VEFSDIEESGRCRYRIDVTIQPNRFTMTGDRATRRTSQYMHIGRFECGKIRHKVGLNTLVVLPQFVKKDARDGIELVF